MNIDTSSEYSSPSEFEILSSTDPSVLGLSERDIRKRTYPALLTSIPARKRSMTKFATYGVRPPATHLRYSFPNLMIFL